MHSRVSPLLALLVPLAAAVIAGTLFSAVAAGEVPEQSAGTAHLSAGAVSEAPPASPEAAQPSLPAPWALPNSRPELLERYQAWARLHPEQGVEQVVLQVNMGLDRPFYSGTQVLEDPDALTVLVNKYHLLPDGYVPQLEPLGKDYGHGSLRPQAARAFRAMADQAREDGVQLSSVSAYRSYEYQAQLYAQYLQWDPQEVVDTFSARPGSSEHQTGLALDINTASLSSHFEDTPAYAWLEEHCAQFGFLLRYPEDKQHITGYRFEPWHYRYVGVSAAQACTQLDLTYEEYLARLSPSQIAALEEEALAGEEAAAAP